MVTKTKKIFVGGLSATSTIEDVKGYFEQFGRVGLHFTVYVYSIRLGLHYIRYSIFVVLYSQTKGVKQKYILCISGLVAYRQYVHSGSDTQLHHWLASGESILLLSSCRMLAARFALSFSLLLDGLQFLWLSRRSLQKLTHPTGVWILPY